MKFFVVLCFFFLNREIRRIKGIPGESQFCCEVRKHAVHQDYNEADSIQSVVAQVIILEIKKLPANATILYKHLKIKM